ncbi:MAG: NADH-quinone oxidoreductase subunit L [Acidobacteria bacterium]|nr:NADH-quinone oxidoreductase subunit L [Acidobacteriota bacterium]
MLKWITLAPLVGAILNGFLGKRLGERFVSIVAPASVFVSFVLAALSFSGLLSKTPDADGVRRVTEVWFTWLNVGTFRADFGYLVDPLSGIYILFITFVGFLIHVYATGYMKGDPGFYRFFTYLNLFMFMMLTLVLADNLLLLFVGWEGVGLCSYLLIGYYIKKKEAGDAAKKAFIANRVGDLSYSVGLFLIFATFGSISFVAKGDVASFLSQASTTTTVAAFTFTLIALLLFGGATGKSAQIPLFVWLPDAMAGPTPVSALIHAATMVTAGVYLIARCSAVVVKSPTAMLVIALIGAATAIFAASIGLAQNDIKKVLAYSTVSQLGYMFLACGVGAFGAAIFHVMTHAFFKALLFLGSGSVIHGMHHEQDMRYMGNLKKYMKVTWVTMMIGWLAISGFPLLSGFFSKDEILWKTYSTEVFPAGTGTLLWFVAALTALMTAIYMTRMMVMTFWGEERYDGSPEIHGHGHDDHGHGHDDHGSHGHGHHGHFTPHESPLSMVLPLVILAALSVAGGWVGIPAAMGGSNHFEHFLEPSLAHAQPAAAHGAADAHGATGATTAAAASHGAATHDTSLELGLTGVSVILGFLGIAIGWFIFKKNPLKDMPDVLENKWYVDEVYEDAIINPIENTSRNVLWKIVDVKWIDGYVNALAGSFGALAGILRTTQTGFARSYAAVILAGAVVVIGYFISVLAR